MRERRNGLRFALARQAVGFGREELGKDLDGDVPFSFVWRTARGVFSLDELRQLGARMARMKAEGQRGR